MLVCNAKTTQCLLPVSCKNGVHILVPEIKSVSVLYHSIHIRQSAPVFCSLFNWFKLVHRLIGQSDMHRTLDFWAMTARK